MRKHKLFPKVCGWCGRDFEGRKNVRYCSHDCVIKLATATRKSLHPVGEKICKQCNLPFKVGGRTANGQGKRLHAVFCGVSCQREYNRLHPYTKRPEQARECLVCEKSFVVAGTKRGLQRRYCSPGCRNKGVYHGNGNTICKELSPTDAAYIAGFFDGEGTIGLTGPRSEGQCIGIRMSVANTVKAPIVFMIEATGLGTVFYRPRRKLDHQSCYWWQAAGDGAASLLRQLLPFLKIKQRQAALAIEVQRGLHETAFRADLALQAQMRESMKILNARGALANALKTATQ